MQIVGRFCETLFLMDRRLAQTPYKYLPILHDHLRRKPIHFHLIVHLTDLLGLLLQLRSELFNLLLLFLDLSMVVDPIVGLAQAFIA
jgi:hypothetical protein